MACGAEESTAVATRLQPLELYAHEINNHLTVILGSCDMAAASETAGEDVLFKLAEIRASALAIARLTKDLEPLKN